MVKATHLFHGEWHLDPAGSAYQFGVPAKSATYTITPDGNTLQFVARWVAQDDSTHQMSFSGRPDGVAHPYEDPNVADFLTTTLIDSHTLDTAIEKDEQQLAYARRILSKNAQTMTVTQSGLTPDGKPFSNRSVYRRSSVSDQHA